MNTSVTTVEGRSQRSGSLLSHLAELFRYRELIRNLTVRELKARYRNSVLGFFWSLLNPLAMMIVFTVVFTFVSRDSTIEKFPIFLLCGLLPWNYLSGGIMAGTSSIVANANLVKKAYFPRAVLPIATVLANLVNFLLALVVLFVTLIVFRGNFSPYLFLLPLVILLQTCFIAGLALILSTLNVFYRDTLMIMDVVMLAWFFLTPVFYPIETLPASQAILGYDLDIRRLMYIFNPMASFVSVYRDLLYWGYRTDLDFFIRTTVTALGVLAFGFWFCVRYSPRFSEEV